MDFVTQIYNAVGSGDPERTSALIAEQPSLARARAASSLSILRFAKYMGDEAILASLIAAGPPLDVFELAMVDDAVNLGALLKHDPSLVAAYSDDGFTAVHFAAFFGCTAALRVLLDAGASTAAVTRNFLTNMPLHAAAAGGDLDACQLLLERGADANAPQHGGFRALHTSAFHDSRPMAELLMRHGADPSLASDEGQTPAQTADSQGKMELAAFLRARGG